MIHDIQAADQAILELTYGTNKNKSQGSLSNFRAGLS
jgi:hypothetical protein